MEGHGSDVFGARMRHTTATNVYFKCLTCGGSVKEGSRRRSTAPGKALKDECKGTCSKTERQARLQSYFLSPVEEDDEQ